MTVSAVEARNTRVRSRIPAPPDECLVPFAEAAHRLGRSTDTLRSWHDKGHLPAVITPGGQWSTYESFIDAVLQSSRPAQPGTVEDTAREWFAAHSPCEATA
jgi:hypothetical protein